MMNINTGLAIKKYELKNRVIVPAMASKTADTTGRATKATLKHYARLASSGAALVFAEYSYVSQDGKSEPNQLGASSDAHIGGLRKIAARIRNSGSLSGLQLVHAGGKTSRQMTGGKLIAPSPISTPVKGGELETPDEASLEDIRDLKTNFVLAASRASVAGFDAIEIHAAHGYGLNQWISPLTNMRTDSYGGSLFNRARILSEIVERIKGLNPDTLLSVRLPGQDHMEGGLSSSDCVLISKKLVELGVDIINVSSGIGGWRRPRTRTGEGYLVDDAEKIQKHISAPVIGVGGIQSRKYIEEKLNERAFSIAAIGRGILDNPQIGKELTIL